MYSNTYKNSFATDVLEYLHLIKIKETSNIYSATDYSTTVTLSGNNKDIEKNSISNNNHNSLNFTTSSTEENTDNETINKDPFLVDWNGDDDPEHPYNWSTPKKTIMILQVMLLTAVTYMGSSIYTPGQEAVQKEFHVGHVAATLNLSIYVLGYGIGPIIFSPLSEFATLGRQNIYIITLFCFCIFQIGAATVKNYGGMVVIRFISGIFCSPALATGGATVTDIMKPELVPVVLGLWAVGAIAAPVLAPLLGAAILEAKDWRWIFWLLLWMCAATLIILIFFFPETHHDNILVRRARRLRKETGDQRYYTTAEKKESELDMKSFILSSLYKPIKIIIKEPIVLAFDVYIALCYGIFYLFFEAFPIVFVGIYHFTVVELGLAFMGFQVGCIFAYAIYLTFLSKYLAPRFKNGLFVPEDFMVLSMIVSWCLPFSLFFFGWTAGIHWILPIVAEVFFVINTFNIFQTVFAYLGMSYPEHVASVFAGNGLMRAGFASAFPLFGQAMFNNLGSEKYPVGWGSSLLGFIGVGVSLIPFVIYKYGAFLRSKSSFTN
ncbi:hypothetical protein Kpol_1018p195 [Vanderwaltozyma polyspora DSM 70294]|uniref:Major facilitator superfamily (MFS) profile domain-containing protein n=1 Tax=Vanderwaltozyma polyspora (strain ATCC 22028 / DSM 70294 / BCRC 21397 / CBS 2163 / NBRC 10782 / NRRL Y-8283 / UCD 57-17) TaxID=436907 RepID=A7TE33_VANPO|nr:uncharacterized protein Kpol_1018p195 [Vanderwaltozyma polyspora DSM 70294]EDO19653.1 hypothetical protein Kpol_1018p195 [Vanderwaltozyma polyspora DSM 70294]